MSKAKIRKNGLHYNIGNILAVIKNYKGSNSFAVYYIAKRLQRKNK